MYVFDTNVFFSLGHYYPSRLPTIWAKIGKLAENGDLRSVKEVRREIESNCQFEHIESWVRDYRYVFKAPTDKESKIVAQIFRKEQFRGLVKRKNILKGLPVADPFVIAAAKVHEGGCVVTQELLKPGGARIPTVCQDLGVECINLEKFLEYENLKY